MHFRRTLEVEAVSEVDRARTIRKTLEEEIEVIQTAQKQLTAADLKGNDIYLV